MLPLEASGLASEEDWHAVKTALLAARFSDVADARRALSALSWRLRIGPYGRAIRAHLGGIDSSALDSAAVRLTQRSLPDAWTLIERL